MMSASQHYFHQRAQANTSNDFLPGIDKYSSKTWSRFGFQFPASRST
jgi:hypothetical protein